MNVFLDYPLSRAMGFLSAARKDGTTRYCRPCADKHTQRQLAYQRRAKSLTEAP